MEVVVADMLAEVLVEVVVAAAEVEVVAAARPLPAQQAALWAGRRILLPADRQTPPQADRSGLLAADRPSRPAVPGNSLSSPPSLFWRTPALTLSGGCGCPPNARPAALASASSPWAIVSPPLP